MGVARRQIRLPRSEPGGQGAIALRRVRFLFLHQPGVTGRRVLTTSVLRITLVLTRRLRVRLAGVSAVFIYLVLVQHVRSRLMGLV